MSSWYPGKFLSRVYQQVRSSERSVYSDLWVDVAGAAADLHSALWKLAGIKLDILPEIRDPEILDEFTRLFREAAVLENRLLELWALIGKKGQIIQD